MTSRARRVHHVNVNAALTTRRAFVASTPTLSCRTPSATLVDFLSFARTVVKIQCRPIFEASLAVVRPRRARAAMPRRRRMRYVCAVDAIDLYELRRTRLQHFNSASASCTSLYRNTPLHWPQPPRAIADHPHRSLRRRKRHPRKAVRVES